MHKIIITEVKIILFIGLHQFGPTGSGSLLFPLTSEELTKTATTPPITTAGASHMRRGTLRLIEKVSLSANR